MKGQAASQVGQSLYPYTRENPDLGGYAAVAAGTIVGFFAVVLISRLASSMAVTAAQGVQQQAQQVAQS